MRQIVAGVKHVAVGHVIVDEADGNDDQKPHCCRDDGQPKQGNHRDAIDQEGREVFGAGMKTVPHCGKGRLVVEYHQCGRKPEQHQHDGEQRHADEQQDGSRSGQVQVHQLLHGLLARLSGIDDLDDGVLAEHFGKFEGDQHADEIDSANGDERRAMLFKCRKKMRKGQRMPAPCVASGKHDAANETGGNELEQYGAERNLRQQGADEDDAYGISDPHQRVPSVQTPGQTNPQQTVRKRDGM